MQTGIELKSLNNCKQVPGYEDYFVTADGKVYSRYRLGRPRTRYGELNGVQRWPDGIVSEVVGGPHKAGYRLIGLMQNGKRSMKTLHAILLETFVGPCPEGMECRHLDGNPSNNSIGNLEWGTPLENKRDKDRHGTTLLGENHQNSILTEAIVREIKKRIAPRGKHNTSVGNRHIDIAKEYGVTPACISAISIGRTWTHVH